MLRMTTSLSAFLLWTAALAAGEGKKIAPPHVELIVAPEALAEPFTGRVLVVLSRTASGDGPPRQSWFKPEPFFAQDVKGLVPGKPWRFQPEVGLPARWDDLTPGKYHLQAVLDRDLGGQSALSSPGNIYSKAAVVEIGPASGPATLRLDQLAPIKTFKE